jgi:hypothetical protein
MTPRRETRRAARLAQRTALAKTINEEPKETSRSSSILQTLKADVEEKQKSSRANSIANSSEKIPVAPIQYKPPTKDELLLFGEPEENPLMTSKKAEAQTEIVATKNLVEVP